MLAADARPKSLRSRVVELWQPAHARLALIGLATLAIYGLAFVRPFNLFQWWSEPGQTIASIEKWNPASGLLFLAAISALFALYWLASRSAIGAHSRRAWQVIIGGAICFNGVLVWLYPVDAADIFDYIMRARLQTTYQANPFYQTPDQFKTDLFFPYVGWADIPSAYGPWWETIAAGTSRLAGDGFISNVVAFKLLAIVGYAATCWVIWLVLRETAPERALYGVTIFAWNPLVLYVTAGNGHNDTLMTFFMVLGLFFVLRRRYTLAVLAEFAGVLIKFIPALLIPVILVAGLRHIAGWRRRLGYVALTGGACLLLLVLSYAPYWQGGDIIGSTRRTAMFTTSLPTLLQVSLDPVFGAPLSERLAGEGALILLAGFTGGETWYFLKRNARASLAQGGAANGQLLQPFVEGGVRILLFYLLVSCLWFQQWYALWPLALAALLPDGLLQRGALLLTLAGNWKMPIFEYWLASGRILPDRAWREWWVTLGTLGAPWAYFLYHFAAGAAAAFRKRLVRA